MEFLTANAHQDQTLRTSFKNHAKSAALLLNWPSFHSYLHMRSKKAACSFLPAAALPIISEAILCLLDFVRIQV